jgi:transposase
MSKVNGLTRGDVRRNARKAALRELVPAGAAVVGVDLGERKQALVVTGADNRVVARRSLRAGVHELGVHLDWARDKAVAAGYGTVTVACEPTGSRWMVVQELCAARGLALVCVQPLVSHLAREQQDLTGDKTDEGDCELIAGLARELRCYVPEVAGAGWAELRAAGRDRAALITRATAAKQLIRDQLGLVAPGLLAVHSDPLESATWLACLQAAVDSGGPAGGCRRRAGRVGRAAARADRGEVSCPAVRACPGAADGPRCAAAPGRGAGGPAVCPPPPRAARGRHGRDARRAGHRP